jgi:GDP-L-fucose synthase
VDNLRIDAGLLAAVGEFRPEHLIVMLSTCMYPDRLPDDRYPMTEDMFEDGPPAPTNAGYALAKRALHLGARAVGSQFGVPWTALVPANLYGPGDHFGSRDSHFLAAAVRRIEEARRAGRPEVTFFGTGRALRQYVFADDVARLVARLVSGGPRHAAFNVAPEGARSIRNLAGLVARVAGYAGQIRFSAEGPDGQYRKDVTSARLRAACPAWAEIETPLEEGVRQTVEWYRAHVATR